MVRRAWAVQVVLAAIGAAAVSGMLACRQNPGESTAAPALVGAWKSQVQVDSGALAGIEGFEFMYAFHSDRTMTESSNYDAAPPVPPAYGVWRKTGPNRYEARYEFFTSRIPAPDEIAAASGGWLPAGHGLLTETIDLAADGNSFTSAIQYALFDETGAPVEGGGSGTGRAVRIRFP